MKYFLEAADVLHPLRLSNSNLLDRSCFYLPECSQPKDFKQRFIIMDRKEDLYLLISSDRNEP